MYGFWGVALFVVGGLLLANAEEPVNGFLTVGLACMGAGLYLLIVGAVARGTQVAAHGGKGAYVCVGSWRELMLRRAPYRLHSLIAREVDDGS
jgi:hypothetical protein